MSYRVEKRPRTEYQQLGRDLDNTYLEWFGYIEEWSDMSTLPVERLGTVADIAARLRYLNNNMARLQRETRNTNAVMNSKFIGLCRRIGVKDSSFLSSTPTDCFAVKEAKV